MKILKGLGDTGIVGRLLETQSRAISGRARNKTSKVVYWPIFRTVQAQKRTNFASRDLEELL